MVVRGVLFVSSLPSQLWLCAMHLYTYTRPRTIGGTVKRRGGLFTTLQGPRPLRATGFVSPPCSRIQLLFGWWFIYTACSKTAVRTYAYGTSCSKRLEEKLPPALWVF